MQRYAVALTTATRHSPDLALGASPRATLHLVRAAKAYAALARPRLRPARRRADAGPAGARAPAAAQRRGRHERSQHRLDPRPDRGVGAGAGRRLHHLSASADGDTGCAKDCAGLTTRGRAFVAAGTTAVVCAVLLGQDDLTRVGVLLVALPLITAYLVGRSRYRLALVRTITPQLVTAGQPAQVQLEITNEGRTPTGLLLLEDHVPYVLGTRPRFVRRPASATAGTAR